MNVFQIAKDVGSHNADYVTNFTFDLEDNHGWFTLQVKGVEQHLLNGFLPPQVVFIRNGIYRFYYGQFDRIYVFSQIQKSLADIFGFMASIARVRVGETDTTQER